MVSSIEVAGLILIVVGILYTFLKALGRFSSKDGEEGEIESKMLTVKGGPGIILVGLGVFLLIIGYVGGDKVSSDIPPNMPSTTVEGNIPQLSPANIITPDYLLGKWIKSDKKFSITFYSDGSFLSKDMSDSSTYKGKYDIIGSDLQLTSDSGQKDKYPLSYVDEYTFKMGDAVYSFDTSGDTSLTTDYLLGKWSKSDKKYAFIFYSDGRFILEDTSGSSPIEGNYKLINSKLQLTLNDGEVLSYSINYIDEYTVKIGEAIFSYVQPAAQTTTSTLSYSKITMDYLTGEWTTQTTQWTEVLAFTKDGTFGEAISYSDTGKIDSSGGTYELIDSKLILYHSTGKLTVSLTYVDWNTMKIDDVIYTRIIN